ncbi:MAG: hydrolase, partial [Adlercreutzia sp.]
GGATEGENGADGEDGQAVVQPARPKLPDPVFGEDVSEDNLVNPQQKPDSSFIYDTSISALQEADSYLNNQTVQVTGEVIGDRIRAEFDPGYSWIVLQGSDRAHSEIPVFMDTESTEVIDTYGAYGRKGTTLQVRGTFHLICPEHEGLTDLHADAVTFVEKGSVTEQPFDIGAFLPGLMLVAIGFIMLIVFHQMREGQR